MFIIPVLIAAFVAWLMFRATGSIPLPQRAGRIDEAVEIVRQRFARGEIDAQEYSRLVTGLTCSQ